MLAAYDRQSNQLISIGLSNSEFILGCKMTDVLLLNLQPISAQTMLWNSLQNTWSAMFHCKSNMKTVMIWQCILLCALSKQMLPQKIQLPVAHLLCPYIDSYSYRDSGGENVDRESSDFTQTYSSKSV